MENNNYVFCENATYARWNAEGLHFNAFHFQYFGVKYFTERLSLGTRVRARSRLIIIYTRN